MIRARKMTAAASLAVIALFLPSCTSANKVHEHDLSGRVLDSRTGTPIVGAAVVADKKQTITDDSGAFQLLKVADTDVAVSVTSKYYKLDQASGPTKTPYTMTIRLVPIPVAVAVTSNLTHTAIPATIIAAGVATSAPHGSAIVFGVGRGDSIRVMSDGYDTQVLKLATAGKATIVLVAGPKATAIHLANAQISQDYKIQADFVHPTVYKYVSRATIIAAFRKSDTDGYGLIRWKLVSLTMVPAWRFPGCNGAGITTYRHVAAVEYTAVNSAPQGASQNTRGIEHLVKSSTGRWSWFPIVTGCEG